MPLPTTDEELDTLLTTMQANGAPKEAMQKVFDAYNAKVPASVPKAPTPTNNPFDTASLYQDPEVQKATQAAGLPKGQPQQMPFQTQSTVPQTQKDLAFEQKRQDLQQEAPGFFAGVGEKIGEQAQSVSDFGSALEKTFSSTPEERLQLRQDLSNAKTREERKAIIDRYNEGKITASGILEGTVNTIKNTVLAPAITSWNLLQAAPDVAHLVMLAGKISSGTATPEEIKKVGDLVQSANQNLQEGQAPIKAVAQVATAPIPGAAAALGGTEELAKSLAEGKGFRESLGRASVVALEDFTASKVVNKLLGIKNPLEKPVADLPPRNKEMAIDLIQRTNKMDPTKAIEFNKMAGSTPGEWLLNRGIVEKPAKTVEILTDRFSKTKDMFDNAVSQLPGRYQPTAARDMLEDLIGFYERTKNKAAPDARKLLEKLNNEGLTSDEILNGAKRPYEQNFKMNYLKDRNAEMVTRANNLDSQLRDEWYDILKQQGFDDAAAMAKEIQASRFLADQIGRKIIKQSGNNAFDLFDSMLLTAGTISPKSLAVLGIKNAIGSNTLKTELARFFGRVEKGAVKEPIAPVLTGSKYPKLPAPKEGAPMSSITKPIEMPKETATTIEAREATKRVKEKTSFNAGEIPTTNYRSQHQIDVKTSVPITKIDEDILSKFVDEFKRQYGYPALKSKELNKLKSIISNPDADITIYRASPKNELNSGDWVTIDKTYANDIKRQNGGRVFSYTVKANELYYPKTIEGFRDLPSLNKWGAFRYTPTTSSK